MPAPNGLRGEAAFGDDHTLTVNFDTLCTIETVLGRSWGEIEGMMQAGKTGLTELRAIIWACLRDKHSDITRNEAGDLIWAIGMEETGASFGKALEAFSATSKAKVENPPKAE